jgi:hypothetical protein
MTRAPEVQTLFTSVQNSFLTKLPTFFNFGEVYKRIQVKNLLPNVLINIPNATSSPFKKKGLHSLF